MASVKSAGYFNPKMMPGDGRAVFINDSAAVSANPSVNDTHDFHLPGGFELSTLRFKVTDMDTNGSPTLAAKIGYAPVDPNSSLAADDDYFRAAAALGQAAAQIECDFVPITFQEPVRITVTWTAVSATFAAGTVYMTAAGNAKGAR
jgi:hypothetical protein